MSKWLLLMCVAVGCFPAIYCESEDSNGSEATVQRFSSKIRDIITFNGYSRFLEFLEQEEAGWARFKELSGYFGNARDMTDADKILNRLTKTFSNIRHGQEPFLEALLHQRTSGESLPRQCGPNLPDLADDVHLKIKVSRRASCYLHPNNQPPVVGQRSLLSRASGVLAREANSVGDHRQVLAFTALDGSTVLYPGLNVTAADLNIPQRQWLDGFLHPIPKDIVFLLETSSLMTRPLTNRTGCESNCRAISLLTDAVYALLNSLSTKDRVAVVMTNQQHFGQSRQAPQSCTQSEMAFVTKDMKKNLLQLMGEIRPGGIGFNISEAFMRAFRYFRNDLNPPVSAHGRELILIPVFASRPLTESEYEETVQAVRVQNEELNKTVLIMGLYIKTDQGSNTTELNSEKLLESITHWQVKGGGYTSLNYKVHIQKLFHDTFSRATHHFTIASHFPLIGPTIQYCSTAHTQQNNQRQFVGLLCSIRPTEDLEALIRQTIPEYMKSYTFIVDGTGRFILHPALKPAQEPDNFVDFETLEKFPQAGSLLQRIVRRERVSITVERNFSTPRINDIVRRVPLRTVKTNYTCAPISGTDLSVCLVFMEGEHYADVRGTDTYPQRFLYHRLDLMPLAYRATCLHYNMEVYLKKATYMLTEKAYTNPLDYKGRHQTERDAMEIIEYMSDAKGDIGIKVGVREMVSVVSQLTWMWSKEYEQISFYGKWLYAGFINGLFVCFPGTQSEDDYDHTERPWYKLAIANPDKIVFTRPYRDYAAGEKDFVISICKAITTRITTIRQTTSDFTIGVLCVDHTLYHFNSLVHQYMQDLCPRKDPNKRCFFIDDSGYIIDHETFHDPDEEVLNIHINDKEWIIAEKLWDHRILQKKYCTSLSDQLEVPFWEVNLGGRKSYTFSGNGTIYDMESTNLFLIVVDGTLLSRGYKRPIKCYSQHCSPDDLSNCPCPAPFDICDNTYDGSKSELAGVQKSIPICPSHVYDPHTDIDPVRSDNPNMVQCITPACNLDYRRCEDFDCKHCTRVTKNGPEDRCTSEKTCEINEEVITIQPAPPATGSAVNSTSLNTMSVLTIFLTAAMSFLFVAILVLVIMKCPCVRRNRQNPILNSQDGSSQPTPDSGFPDGTLSEITTDTRTVYDGASMQSETTVVGSVEHKTPDGPVVTNVFRA